MYNRRRLFFKQRCVMRGGKWQQEIRICLFGWGIGILGGIFFFFMLDEEMQKILQITMEQGIWSGIEHKGNSLDFFLKQSYSYGKLYGFLWITLCWNYGFWGIRAVSFIEGFLLSYAHAVWIYTYGWSGVWIGFGMQWVQNLLIVFTLCVMTCLSAWLKGIDKKTAWVIRISIAVLAAFSVAAVETFGIPIFFEWVNRQ